MVLKLVTIFFFFFISPLLADSSDPAFNDDVLALIVFKAGLNDPEGRLASWNEDDDNPCNWVGVKCDPGINRVTELHLDGFSLSGHISRSLLRLRFLQVLSLSDNSFAGTITPVLAQLDRLRVIDFTRNNLSGSIPDELFQQCRSLRVLSLAKNNLSGKIPDSLASCVTLEGIDLSSNSISGFLPSGLWSLVGLRWLDLSENLIEGEIPKGIETLYDIRTLNLRNNKFSGQIPEDIGGCLLLKSLDLSENYISGTIPGSMQKLSLCTSLSLRGNSLTGTVPDWVGDLRSLQSLDLSANSFSGEITPSLGDLQFLKDLNLSKNWFTGGLPESLASCVSLFALDVSRNSLTGSLPPWLFRLGIRVLSMSRNNFSGTVDWALQEPMAASYPSLEILDLSSNELSGEIPSAIGNFSSLQLLNMSRNFLGGSFPSTMGKLKSLEVLDLSSNWLNGTIPDEIGGASSLQELSLENNFLAGKIPNEIQNCSSLTSLILSRNNFTGPVPMAIANLANLQVVDFSSNDFSGSLPKKLTNLSRLIAFNISHNHIEGELPSGGFFDTIPLSSVSGNPSLCGSVLNQSCPSVHPKPIVLNPNSSSGSSNASLTLSDHKRIVLSISALVAIGAAVLIALGVIVVCFLNVRVRSSMSRPPVAFTMSHEDDYTHSPNSASNYGKLVMFTGDAGFVVGAQALLNKDSELGRGGFGTVYRTVLKDGRPVAIKKLNITSLIKSQEDFEREMKKLGSISHHNLVSLEGYYWTPSLQLIINEFVSGGTLYKHLHEGQSGNFLSWHQRFKVILGTAKGLAQLHQTDIIHYNMKSTNVLIDEFGEPKVSDFGLARLLPMLDRYILSSKIQSALGYMAPEFACQTVKITEKCDVYGFGILVLEVMTGKRPVEYMEDDVVVLCDMVRAALEEGRVEECVDGRLSGNFPAEEAIPVIKLGLICASQVPSSRPDMDEIVRILELIQCPSEAQEELE